MGSFLLYGLNMKKIFVTLFLSFLATVCHSQAYSASEWSDFKSKFIQNGRIIDSGNANISHSEGQGIGLLMSVKMKDKSAFDSIYRWTVENLQKTDKTFAWKWEQGRITDKNNATDGELYIVWALLEASDVWGMEQYKLDAKKIIDATLSCCVKKIGGKDYLLPGTWGFEEKEYIVVNPSYYIYPAIKKIQSKFENPIWDSLIGSGMRVSMGWGSFGLPADWVAVMKPTEELAPWKERPFRFGFEAIRVGLFMKAYNPKAANIANISSWLQKESNPGWIDLNTTQRAEYSLPPGFRAVGQYLNGAKIKNLPVKEMDYYNNFLYFLSKSLNSAQ